MNPIAHTRLASLIHTNSLRMLVLLMALLLAQTWQSRKPLRLPIKAD